ncbi:MAG: ankyrin repeat domain-containing protein [Candidatus Babeliales bacterium]|nr:ankyrin repeat domain-containing protein [Candidatus Babeliales bacterium]
MKISRSFFLTIIFLISYANFIRCAQAPELYPSKHLMSKEYFCALCRRTLALEEEFALDTLFDSSEKLKQQFEDQYVELFDHSLHHTGEENLLDYIVERKPQVIPLFEKNGAISLILKPSLHKTKTLVLYGADKEREVKVSGYSFSLGTPLVYASRLGDNDIVSFLLSQGANIDAVDGSGKNAFEVNQVDLISSITGKQFVPCKKIYVELKSYYRSRKENRIFQQCVGKSPAMARSVVELISEYTLASHPAHPRQDPWAVLLRPYISAPACSLKTNNEHKKLLIQVKLALYKNDAKPLLKFIKGPLRNLSVEDAAGNTVLFAAARSGNADALSAVVDRLKHLDAKEKNINNRFEKAINHTNEYGVRAFECVKPQIDDTIAKMLKPEPKNDSDNDKK